MAIKMLKNGKASEEDNITTVPKKSGKAVMKKLEQIIIIKAWREKEMPKVWNLLNIYPI